MEIGIFKVLECIFPENTDFKKIKIHIHFFSYSIDKSFYQKCYEYSIEKCLNIQIPIDMKLSQKENKESDIYANENQKGNNDIHNML